MKVARTVEPNKGTQAKFRKKLLTFLKRFRQRVLNEVLLYLDDESGLARDASLTFRPDDPFDRAKLRRIKEKINSLVLRDPERFRRNVDEFIARNMMGWLKTADKETQSLAQWYVKNLAADVGVSQKASLMSAGIPKSVLDYEMRGARKHFFITPNAIEKLPKMVDETTKLITNIATSELSNIRSAFIDAYQGKGTYSQIIETLEQTEGFTRRRAERVALDQSLKISQKIQQENCKAVGITKGVWIHRPGTYTSRKSHIAMNGKTFDLSEGLYDPEVKKKVIPGELFYCFPKDSEINFTHPIKKLFRRFYSGKLAVIETNSGEVFKATPNHPILTSRGWVGAGDLNVGDNLIDVKKEIFKAPSIYADNKVSTIGELFDAFNLTSRSPLKFCGSYRDFHGDGSNSNIDVIDVNSLLADRIEPQLVKSIVESFFTWTNSREVSFTSKSPFDTSNFRFMAPFFSELCRRDEFFSFLGTHFSHSYVIGLGTIAALYSVIFQNSGYNDSRNSIFFRQGEFGTSGNILRNDLLFRMAKSSIRSINSKFLTLPPESNNADSDRGASLLLSQPFFHEVKSIKKKRFINWSGHVYNLETMSGYYINNYTVVSNCRCLFRAVLPD